MNVSADLFPAGFRLLRVVGQGANGVVYEARRESDGLRVAVKLLHGERGSDPRLRERFQREAETVARIQHEAVVPILGGDMQGTRPYIVMPFIDGWAFTALTSRGRKRDSDLREVVEAQLSEVGGAARARGVTPWEQWVLTIGAELSDALGAAHRVGVIHRDIKPENLLLDRSGKPHLLDFGLAHVHAAPALTRTGELLGTPLYMAPEQVRPGGEPDVRSDIYALALILAELLTGQSLQRGDDLPELYRSIVEDEAPRIDRLRDGLSRPVADVLAAALRRRPDERFATAPEFSRALRAVAAGEALSLPRGRSLRFRRRLAACAALLLFAVPVGGSVAMLLSAAKTQPEMVLPAGDPRVTLERAVTRVHLDPDDAVAAATLTASVAGLLEGVAADRLRFRHGAAAGRLSELLRLEDRPSWRHARAELQSRPARELEALATRLEQDRDPRRRVDALRRLGVAEAEQHWDRETRSRLILAVLERERSPAVIAQALATGTVLELPQILHHARQWLSDAPPFQLAPGDDLEALRCEALSALGGSSLAADLALLEDWAAGAGACGHAARASLAALGSPAAGAALGRLLDRAVAQGAELPQDLLGALLALPPSQFTKLQHPRRAVDALVVLVEAKDDPRAVNAAWLLSHWKIKRPELVDLMVDRSLELALRTALVPAVGAIAADGYAVARGALIDLMQLDNPASLRAEVVAALARQGVRMRRDLIALLKDEPSTSVLVRALLALGSQRSDVLVDLASRAIRESHDPIVRAVALVGLGLAQATDADSRDLLVRTIETSRHAEEVSGAVWSLARTTPDARSVRVLAAALLRESERAEARRRGGAAIQLVGRWVRDAVGDDRLPGTFSWIQEWSLEPREPVGVVILALQRVLTRGSEPAIELAAKALSDYTASQQPLRFRAAAIAALGRGTAPLAVILDAFDALAAEPLPPELSRELALAFDRLGRTEYASSWLARTPSSGEDAFIAGLLWLRRGDPAKAREQLRIAGRLGGIDPRRVGLEPELVPVRFVRGLFRRVSTGR